MTGYTPGPWRAVRDPGHYHSLSTVVAGEPSKVNKRDRMRVEVGGWAGHAEQEANTRLIAASVEMLNALRSLLRLVERCREEGLLNCDDVGPEGMARAAIAKATGGEP